MPTPSLGTKPRRTSPEHRIARVLMVVKAEELSRRRFFFVVATPASRVPRSGKIELATSVSARLSLLSNTLRRCASTATQASSLQACPILRSRQDFLNHPPMHVRQPAVDAVVAERQLLVVD